VMGVLRLSNYNNQQLLPPNPWTFRGVRGEGTGGFKVTKASSFGFLHRLKAEAERDRATVGSTC
jgi:hypothetical protein